ncbi:MAG TPA: YqgE/AlgH family protein [Acidimicrobiales bacterium]|nr:YqgE/AlgH family protein [Acidimicrobiales bacterium]
MSDPPPTIALPVPGSLLVALPTLEEPTFHWTVVLMLAFGKEDGALGVVLNRPNEVPVEALLPGWEVLAAVPDSVFVGGPVSRESVICLATMRTPASFGSGDVEEVPGCARIPGGAGRLATVDLNRRPEEVSGAVERVRLFSGYAGWSAGQLEGELSSGSWLVVPAEDDDAFTGDPDGLWTRVLRRQGGHVSLYAKAPPKLSLN